MNYKKDSIDTGNWRQLAVGESIRPGDAAAWTVQGNTIWMPVGKVDIGKTVTAESYNAFRRPKEAPRTDAEREAATISIPKENLWLHEEVIRLEAEAECLRELVRYQRAELQQARIITDEEELAAKGNNSFDLLTFDELKKQVELLEKQIDSDLDSSLKFSKIANEDADRLNKEIERLQQEVERLKEERLAQGPAEFPQDVIERLQLTEEDRKHLRWAFGLSEYLHREEMRRDEDAMVFARTIADGLRKIISRRATSDD